MQVSLKTTSLVLAWLSTVTEAAPKCKPVQPKSANVSKPVVLTEEDISLTTPTSTVTTGTGTNSTTKYGPTPNPSVDVGDWNNYKPCKNISLYYGSENKADTGAVKMDLTMLSDAVVLEYIDTINQVDCGSPDDNAMTIFFRSLKALRLAVEDWSNDQNLVMITNHFGSCDEEFERGFFVVEMLTPNEDDLSIRCISSKKQLPDIADNLELSFNSIPAATLTKRITLDSSTSLSFSHTLEEDTILFSEPPFLEVTANEASFTSTITFTGYLKYSFWNFKLDNLYFDVDATFNSNLEMAVDIAAYYSQSFNFAPDELSYSLVDVPGIVKLGPGIAFAVGVDLATNAQVDAVTGVSIDIPSGNVHIDVLDSSNTAATGWVPQFHSYANITEQAELSLDVNAALTVELAVDILGGLVDLSSGLIATPGFNNVFKLESAQVIDGQIVDLPDSESVCDQGISVKSDFVFDLTAFATQWWEQSLFNTTIPIADKCYEFV